MQHDSSPISAPKSFTVSASCGAAVIQKYKKYKNTRKIPAEKNGVQQILPRLKWQNIRQNKQGETYRNMEKRGKEPKERGAEH